MTNTILVSVKEWQNYLLTRVPPKRIPKEVVKEFDKAIMVLRRAESYEELGFYGKFNPKPKNPPRKWYRAINLTPQWRLLFKIENRDGHTTIYIDGVSGDHKYD